MASGRSSGIEGMKMLDDNAVEALLSDVRDFANTNDLRAEHVERMFEFLARAMQIGKGSQLVLDGKKPANAERAASASGSAETMPSPTACGTS
jgi:hypothetical protein